MYSLAPFAYQAAWGGVAMPCFMYVEILIVLILPFSCLTATCRYFQKRANLSKLKNVQTTVSASLKIMSAAAARHQNDPGVPSETDPSRSGPALTDAPAEETGSVAEEQRRAAPRMLSQGNSDAIQSREEHGEDSHMQAQRNGTQHLNICYV